MHACNAGETSCQQGCLRRSTAATAGIIRTISLPGAANTKGRLALSTFDVFNCSSMRVVSAVVMTSAMAILISSLAGASSVVDLQLSRPWHRALSSSLPSVHAIPSSLLSFLRKGSGSFPAGVTPVALGHPLTSASAMHKPNGPRKSSLRSPPAPLRPIKYTKTIYAPWGYHFCRNVTGTVTANAILSEPLNLKGYAAFFAVLYCTSSGNPAGTIAIWSYVARELCQTTSFDKLSAHGNAKSHTIMIIHNGVGNITTKSQAFPMVSNVYTVAGPDCFAYRDFRGDVSFAYSGTDQLEGPTSFPIYDGHAPCGTPFAILINNQFATVTLPLCDRVGNVQGWVLGGVGTERYFCLSKSFSNAQVYVEHESVKVLNSWSTPSHTRR